MKINANFDQRVVVHSAELDWIASPMKGVLRRPLDRVGDELARATSVVKYEPGSKFSPHTHTGGEEFFVLEGVFQDEHGDFPAGSYLRNPPNSSHTPGSEPGCVILVKLWQFRPEDRTQIRLDTNSIMRVRDPEQPGVIVTPLYADLFEDVEIQEWAPNSNIVLEAPGGIEVFVLSGDFVEAGESFVKQSWLRLPIGSSFVATAGKEGAKVWMKRNGLAQVDDEIALLKKYSTKGAS